MIVRWGIPTLIYTTLFLAAALWLLPPVWPRLIALPICLFLWCFVVAFFRNPQRAAEGGSEAMIAPADGVIADIEEVTDPSVLDEPCLRIGIFLSVFDVHVNRIPAAAKVHQTTYQTGAFRDARDPQAGEVNEAQTVVFAFAHERDDKLPQGFYAVRQIAGLIARRIVCPIKVGDEFSQGALYGMIRFGSRTELWLPKRLAHVCDVQVGQTVRGGKTVLCRFTKEDESRV